MLERLDATFFLFGGLGNLTDALGEGWSVEDNSAWAIGDESRLNLPLPCNDSRYSLRLTVQPLVHAGVHDTQRLTIDTAAGPLASFSITRQTTIEVLLPLEQTRNRRNLALILRHPDAFRPCDFKPTDDSRLLSLCFLSGTLTRLDDDTCGAAEAASLCQVIVAGGDLARQIVDAMNTLPVLRQRVACHLVSTDPGAGPAAPPMEALRSAAICWEQASGINDPVWSGLRRNLPATCVVRRFASPRMTAPWPFLGADPRLVAEPDRYPGGRYPFGDHIGASLAHLQLPDDVMQLAYESMAEKEMPDLDALLAADRAAWRQLDATQDIQVAEFIVENFRRYRLFYAPPHPTGDLLQHIILQLAAGTPIEDLCRPATLRRELEFLLTGYIGRREELPIHPHVARRFGLAWWRPGMRYRWHSNRWTFEEYALRYIRWTPWRP